MKYILMLTFLAGNFMLSAQNTEKIYKPEANAFEELNQALIQAKSEHKHVLIQIGGNWCPWCHKLHQFFNNDTEIDSIINQHYVLLMINYSRENKNLDLLKKLDYPQRFGFPSLVVLDAEGKRIHTQDSSFLEDGKGYDRQKVIRFLSNWSPAALDPVKYQK